MIKNMEFLQIALISNLLLLFTAKVGCIVFKRRTMVKDAMRNSDDDDGEITAEDLDPFKGIDKEELENLSKNLSLRCNECSGKFCIDKFIPFRIRVKTIVCAAGEICWRGYTHNDTFRGCSNRECYPTSARFNRENETYDFLKWYCCISDVCNSSHSTSKKHVTVIILALAKIALFD